MSVVDAAVATHDATARMTSAAFSLCASSRSLSPSSSSSSVAGTMTTTSSCRDASPPPPVPLCHHTLDAPPPLVTSAVTRSWSDVDPTRLLLTFAATSFTYSLLGHPLFLAIARQQCCRTHVSAYHVLADVYSTCGVRGLFRGAGAAVSGTVLSELVYYFVVEYWKEKLRFRDREWRSFGSGLMADLTSAPLFNPFAVVSQVQMVAGSSFASEHNYMSAWRTTLTLVREQGVHCLFRGTMLTLMVAPLTGAWWLVYEYFKRLAYAAAPTLSACASHTLPRRLLHRLPACCTSHTDNVLINCAVGAAASAALGVVMNPIYVLRLRLQVAKATTPTTRFRAYTIVRDMVQHEGVRAFWKGLGVNVFVAVAGGCAFGVTYEGAKKFSDITDTTTAR